MDARTFQQHTARIAERTDALLADRAATQAGRTLNPKADVSSPATEAQPPSLLASLALETPQATPPASPEKDWGAAQAHAQRSVLHPASVSHQRGLLDDGIESDAPQDQQHDADSSQAQSPVDKDHAGDFTELCVLDVICGDWCDSRQIDVAAGRAGKVLLLYAC